MPSMTGCLHFSLARVVIESAQRVDTHDRRNHEQQDRALASVALVGGLAAAIQPDARGKDDHGCGELDHAADVHWAISLKSGLVECTITLRPFARTACQRRSHCAPMASVARVAIKSSAMRPSTTAPAPLATPRMLSERFTDTRDIRH